MRDQIITLSLFQLLAAKHAIKLEALGMKHSSGKSARKHWAILLGLPQSAKHQQVVDEIEKILKANIFERKKDEELI